MDIIKLINQILSSGKQILQVIILKDEYKKQFYHNFIEISVLSKNRSSRIRFDIYKYDKILLRNIYLSLLDINKKNSTFKAMSNKEFNDLKKIVTILLDPNVTLKAKIKILPSSLKYHFLFKQSDNQKITIKKNDSLLANLLSLIDELDEKEKEQPHNTLVRKVFYDDNNILTNNLLNKKNDDHNKNKLQDLANRAKNHNVIYHLNSEDIEILNTYKTSELFFNIIIDCLNQTKEKQYIYNKFTEGIKYLLNKNHSDSDNILRNNFHYLVSKKPYLAAKMLKILSSSQKETILKNSSLKQLKKSINYIFKTTLFGEDIEEIKNCLSSISFNIFIKLLTHEEKND